MFNSGGNMKQVLLTVMMATSGLVSANELFLDYALGLKQEIFQRIKGCGLKVVHVQDEFLPVPADRLIFSPAGQPLARFKQWGAVGGTRFEWKNPNGGMVHSINQSYSRMTFVTPLMGTVAIVNQFTTVDGRRYNYLCRSQYVPGFKVWDACVRANFVDIVVGKLCRFGHPTSPKQDAPVAPNR